MSNLHIHQSVRPITLETTFTLAGASVAQILYRKPNGQTGAWNASISGNNLTYNISSTDVDIVGNWRLQAYVVIDGEKYYGAEVTQQFKSPIQ